MQFRGKGYVQNLYHPDNMNKCHPNLVQGWSMSQKGRGRTAMSSRAAWAHTVLGQPGLVQNDLKMTKSSKIPIWEQSWNQCPSHLAPKLSYLQLTLQL